MNPRCSLDHRESSGYGGFSQYLARKVARHFDELQGRSEYSLVGWYDEEVPKRNVHPSVEQERRLFIGAVKRGSRRSRKEEIGSEAQIQRIEVKGILASQKWRHDQASWVFDVEPQPLLNSLSR